MKFAIKVALLILVTSFSTQGVEHLTPCSALYLQPQKSAEYRMLIQKRLLKTISEGVIWSMIWHPKEYDQPVQTVYIQTTMRGIFAVSRVPKEQMWGHKSPDDIEIIEKRNALPPIIYKSIKAIFEKQLIKTKYNKEYKFKRNIESATFSSMTTRIPLSGVARDPKEGTMPYRLVALGKNIMSFAKALSIEEQKYLLGEITKNIGDIEANDIDD